jgi:poly-gamma-glutamate synthesis protein (capsule biosynthesis protein)
MQPATSANILKELKVDALTFANNHIMDQGLQGYEKTISVLKDEFQIMGAGSWKDAYKLTIIDNYGIKVGLLNFCELQFGMLSDEWTQGADAIGCAWVNHPKVNQFIVESKDKVDFLVAIVHAGVEMVDVPLPEWRDRYREIIDLGCDAVISHHPHVVQGYETYKGKPIAYSLGNFCFSKIERMENPEWNEGALAVLNLDEESASISMIGTQFKDATLSLQETVSWHNKREKLCSYLCEDKYMQRVNASCQRQMNDYWDLFAMGGLFAPKAFTLRNLARISLHKYDHVHFLNNLRCESHRWCIIRGLMVKELRLTQ